jgi:hypothetical protein
MRIFYLVLVVLYGSWFWWYGGRGEPITHEEVDQYLEQVKANVRAKGREPDDRVLKEFESLAITDDGNEYFMVNLMRWREQAKYAPDSPWANDPDPMAANERYMAGIVPALLRHGGLPVFAGEPSGRFIEDGDARPWDSFVIVRYRSVRDMLEMVAEPAMIEFSPHKWASIEETHVFPVRPMVSLIMVRLTVAVLLIGLALVVSGLRRVFKK